jgi:proteasome activator subunit 4
MAESHMHWGEVYEIGNEKLIWHVPTQDEINFGLELIDAFLVPALAKARELMASTSLESKQLSIELCKVITMIKGFVTGIVTLVEDDGDSPESKARYVLLHG